ncbi:TPA: S8 family peptidase [Staphylococcus aureus]|nr:S8 family peptidase [Staphylococcus aureus]
MSNNLLELRGKRFIQANRTISGGGCSMNSKQNVTIEHINQLINKLLTIEKFWQSEKKPFSGILISVYYNKIIAKSNRINGLFAGKNSNNCVVGAKFNKDKNKHILTYHISEKNLANTIKNLEYTSQILDEKFNGEINKDVFENKGIFNEIQFNKDAISKSLFRQIIADLSYILDFNVEIAESEEVSSLVTIFNTNTDTKKLLADLGIDILSNRIIDNFTVYLDSNEIKILLEKAPYLISMSTTNINNLDLNDPAVHTEVKKVEIPSPIDEPTIGVIDTLFDNSVYFNEWVDYHEIVDENIPREFDAYRHGTAVSSLIVDGPTLNPWLDDGCGRFRVRHFGVAAGKQVSSYSVIKAIKEIVAENNDIKVWNISLGSSQEINDNFISAEASVLDEIQSQYDVIFVIAGTNRPTQELIKIGSPADSINGIVVNSVTKDGIACRYSRKGIALSFFAKPDVSYYGGSIEKFITVCEPLGAAEVAGTSFAAPWISRKLSYMIDILGLSREIAKALLIDSAKGWRDNIPAEEIALYGHGIVPINIQDIISTENDEIKFFVSDISEKWNTYNYSFPIPLKDDKYPFIFRATMCYFPSCNRAQGVDYTNTELNLHFGRIKDNGKFIDIQGDKQNQDNENDFYLYESEARKNFRKWDNVKYISESDKKNKRAKLSYKNKNWGLEIKTNNRLNADDGVGLKFGVVVTMKEINGVNRIDEFIRNCNLDYWIVNVIDVEVKNEINQTLNEEVEFD